MPVRKVSKEPVPDQTEPEDIPWAGEIEAPANDTEMTPIEASVDGSLSEALHAATDETGALVADVTDAQFEALKAVEPNVAPLRGYVVRALQSFGDIQTNRSYKTGDIVPWGITRARHYAKRGLVEIITDAVPE